MKEEKTPPKINDDLTYRIIGCAMNVHNQLGNGFQEVIYQRALSIELQKADISHRREVEMPIFYDGQQIGKRRADFIIDEHVMVELKAIIRLEDAHLAQGLNYLVAYNLDKGLLINFRGKSLETKRLLNPRKRPKNWSEKRLS